MTAARPSDWAVSPHHQAAQAAAVEAAREQAVHDLEWLDAAMVMFQAQLKAYCDHGLKAEAETVKVRIARTENLIRERRAVLEGKATR